jgi:hypothetical protein
MGQALGLAAEELAESELLAVDEGGVGVSAGGAQE